MTRFTDIDLARLPALPLGLDTHEAIYQARIAELRDRLVARGWPYDVEALLTDLGSVVEGAGAFRELLAVTRRDDAIRAILLASSWGAFLDHLGAGQVPPVLRKPDEHDEDFRRRIQLAPEALSTAGPEGAYLFFALEVPGVKTAAVYGPMSFGGTSGDPFAPLGEVHVPIVASEGDGDASPELVAAVQAALREEDRRPIADFVTVSAATLVPYAITATIKVGPGADATLVQAEAERRLARQAQRQHRPGAAMLRQMLFGAAYVADADGVTLVEEVDLVSPAEDVNAAPIAPATPDAAYRAPFCTGVEVSIEVIDG